MTRRPAILETFSEQNDRNHTQHQADNQTTLAQRQLGMGVQFIGPAENQERTSECCDHQPRRDDLGRQVGVVHSATAFFSEKPALDREQLA